MIEDIKLDELKTKESHQKALKELYIGRKKKISTESNEKISKLDKDIKEKESNVSNLTLKLEAATMERDTITKQLNDLITEKLNTDTANQSQIEGLKNQITQFQGKVGQLEQERTNALQEIQTMQKKGTELEQSLKNLESEKNIAISSLETKNIELQANLNQINANFEANKKEWAKFAADATTSYNQMINQKDTTINGVKSDLLKSEETVKSLTSEKEKLASQMDKKIAEIQNQIEKITNEKGTIQNQNEQERVEGQKKLNQTEKEIQRLLSEKDNIQKQGEQERNRMAKEIKSCGKGNSDTLK